MLCKYTLFLWDAHYTQSVNKVLVVILLSPEACANARTGRYRILSTR